MTAIEILNKYLKGREVIFPECSEDHGIYIIKEIQSDIDWEWMGLKIKTTTGKTITGVDFSEDVFTIREAE